MDVSIATGSEECPNSKDGHGHCRCWWDGEICCWCGAPAMSKEEMIQQGVIDEDE